MSGPALARFTARRPCPICGGHPGLPAGEGRRCWGYIDSTGGYARCTREEYAGDLEPNDDDTFSHRIDGTRCRCGDRHPPHGPSTVSPALPGVSALPAPREAAKAPEEAPTGPAPAAGPAPVVRHEVRGADGALLAVHVRQGDGPTKRVWWEGGLDGRRPADMLYGLDRLAEAPVGEPVFLAEGEKAADALSGLGRLALGTVTGAGGALSQTAAVHLAGRAVYLFPDADDAGRGHMERNAAVLAAAGAEPWIIDWPQAPSKGDAADLVALLGSEGSGARLTVLVRDARPWRPPESGRGGALHLSIVPIDQFAAVEEPSAEALLGDEADTVLAAGGTFVLHGKGGGGKTTLEVDLAMHLAAGSPWLGLPVPRPCRVLLIENEGPRGRFRRKVARKLRAWGGPPVAENLLVADEPWARFSFGEDALRGRLAECIGEHGIDVLCAGPVVGLGIEGGGTPAEVRAFMDLIEQVRAGLERPLAVVLVHHDNKAGSVSGAWEGVPDTLAHVRARGNGATSVEWVKVRWGSGLHGAVWKLIWREGESFERDTTPEAAEEDIRDAILRAVGESPGCSWNEIDKSIRGKDRRKRSVRDDLIGEGAIVNLGGGAGGSGGGGMRLHLPDDAAPDPLAGGGAR